MDLREAMASGVVVEFRDSMGNSAGSAVYFDWSGRPVPSVGDHFACRVKSGRMPLSGCVKFRSFDVQTDEDGQPCVWVRLVIELGASMRIDRPRNSPRYSFSEN